MSYIKIIVDSPKDGDFIPTINTTLRFTLESDVLVHDLGVDLNNKGVFLKSHIPSGTHDFSVPLELKPGINKIVIWAFSYGTADSSKQIYVRCREGDRLPVRWDIPVDVQRIRVKTGEEFEVRGKLLGYVVWEPPALRPLPNRKVELYLKKALQHGYGELIGSTTTNEFGSFSFRWSISKPGSYALTVRFPGDGVWEPGTFECHIYVKKEGETQPPGGEQPPSPWPIPPPQREGIAKPRDGEIVQGIIDVVANSGERPSVYLDGVYKGDMEPLVAMGNWVYHLDTRPYPDGDHKICIKTSKLEDCVVVRFMNHGGPTPPDVVETRFTDVGYSRFAQVGEPWHLFGRLADTYGHGIEGVEIEMHLEDPEPVVLKTTTKVAGTFAFDYTFKTTGKHVVKLMFRGVEVE